MGKPGCGAGKLCEFRKLYLLADRLQRIYSASWYTDTSVYSGTDADINVNADKHTHGKQYADGDKYAYQHCNAYSNAIAHDYVDPVNSANAYLDADCAYTHTRRGAVHPII